MSDTHYVDGYVLPLPKNKVEDYRRMASIAGKVWREHGALEYRECIGDDLNIEHMRPFTALADAGPDETVVFAYVVFNSREHRDEVNAKVMADPRLAECGTPENMPFDCKRMAWGGFKTLVHT